MAKRLLLSLVAILAAVGCCTVKDRLDPEIEVWHNEGALQDRPQGLLEVPDMYYLRIELVMFTNQQVAYPQTWTAFQNAVAEWTAAAPLEIGIMYEDQAVIPWVDAGFVPSRDREHIIQVQLIDFKTILPNLPDRLIGLWIEDTWTIYIDAAQLEDNPARAYSVALHEIGHMLGLPHIVGQGDMNGVTGDLVVLDEDVKNYVMYPLAIKDLPQNTLNTLEIHLVTENMKHFHESRSQSGRSMDCFLGN